MGWGNYCPDPLCVLGFFLGFQEIKWGKDALISSIGLFPTKSFVAMNNDHDTASAHIMLEILKIIIDIIKAH